MLPELRDLFERMQHALSIPQLDCYNALYTRFHVLLIGGAENSFLSRQWQALNLLEFSNQFVPFITEELLRTSHVEHEALLAALEAGDARRAESCMRRHIVHFTESIRRLPDRRFASEAV